MSEPKLISPMLDNFVMGDPITDRNGVRCCPAMEQGSDEKYIVKIISNPASQSKLDAMILSGAYPDVASATEYFKSLADGIIEEANILQKLSLLEGFLPYDKFQLVPMESEAGYDVYILSKYRRTLEQKFRKDAMTHLEALNLGLDLCAALAVCRRSGYIYIDLKPENVYLNNEGAYRIGDIGFVKLNSLKYASLPDRYRSAYTAPELVDAFSSLNTSVDIYALGLILYQVFNGGQLPIIDSENDTPLSAPDYADYEMAEIILKACAADPADRWQDPVEMGQALVSYMQRNGAHDTPIVPVVVENVTEANIAPVTDEEVATEPDVEINEPADNDASTLQPIVNNECEQDANEESTEDVTDEKTTEDISAEESTDPSIIISEEENLEDLNLADVDETAPGQEDALVDYTEVSDEVSDILVQADDLLAHPTPDPVVAPEPIEVVLPDPIENTEDETPTETGSDATEAETEDNTAENTDEAAVLMNPDVDTNEEDDEEAVIIPAKRSVRWWVILLIVLGVAAIAALGYLFYTQYYLQPVESMCVQDNSHGSATVVIDSEIPDEKLTVVCTDIYGNQMTSSVSGGNAEFTGLKPDAAYNFQLEISGFHGLTGETFTSFTTPPLINILQFLAVTGTDDGSAILSFTVEGRDCEQWTVSYATAGEAAQTATFSGHVHTLTGLTVGSEYTFTLTPVSDDEFTGVNIINHTAAKVVKPEKLRTTGYADGKLSISWVAPEGAGINEWTVRCYNATDFDKTISVTDTTATIEGVQLTSDLAVEVTAAGMSVSTRLDIVANAAVVSDIKFDESSVKSLGVSWTSSTAPEGGWVLAYTVDGSPVQQLTISEGNSAVIAARVPGALYSFTLTTAAGENVVAGMFEFQTADAETFSGYSVTYKNMTFSMCKTPSQKNWDRYDLAKSDYTSTFTTGTKASFLVKMNRKYSVSSDKITTLYVIRDKSNNIVSISYTEAAWRKMWLNNYCELDIPSLPSEAGKYTISVYFNGASVHKQSFTIS